jgi:geranylgeranyl pyrophosphate synthase
MSADRVAAGGSGEQRGGAFLDAWLRDRRAIVERTLDQHLALPADGDPGRLVEAMRYSLLSPGKRLRPLLALAAAEAVGATAEDEDVRVAAAAVELVHCYSLVHDDLPSMDDDDVRRGRPTNHKVFGEATAILAGDALLTLAFEWLADAGARVEARRAGAAARYLRASLALARGAGMSGMVRGQARDLGEPAPDRLTDVERLHAEKTGALFVAALEIGGEVGGGGPEQLTALRRFGTCYGLAFQHADDLADEDHVRFAPDARARVSSLTAEAIEALGGFDQRAEPLRGLAQALAAVPNEIPLVPSQRTP